MSVLKELRRTPKGQLKYDRQGLCMQSIEGVLGDIQSEMDSMQVCLSSPGTFSPEPSFGLSCDSEPGTPLIVRTVRLVTPSPGGCGAESETLKAIRVTLQNTAALRRDVSNGQKMAEKPKQSPLAMKITADLTTPKIGNRVVDVASRPRVSLSPSSTPGLSPKTPECFMRPWPGRHSTPITPLTIDLTASRGEGTSSDTTGDSAASRHSKFHEGTPVGRLPTSGKDTSDNSDHNKSHITSPNGRIHSTENDTSRPLGSRKSLSTTPVERPCSEEKDASAQSHVGGQNSVQEASKDEKSPKTSGLPVETDVTPFTPRTHDKLLHEERQRHIEEAREKGRARLAAAEARLQQLRLQHQLAQRQLAADQLRRQLAERERRGAQRQLSEQQLQQTSERIEEDRQRREKDLRAALERKQADAEAVRERAARERRVLDQMVAAQKQLRVAVTNVVNKIKGCADRAQLQSSPATGLIDQLKKLMTKMDGIVSAGASEEHVNDAEELVKEAQQLELQVAKQIDEINASVAPPTTPETKPVASPVATVAPSAAAIPSASVAPVTTEPPVDAADSKYSSGLSASLEESQLWHDDLRKKLTEFQASFSDILTDPKWKKFKFDCQKAVNTPINAISPVSSAHLKDKLEKLRCLLRGEPVTVAGQQQVSAAAHPRGVNFCVDLVAKKFVRQGEDVVSSKPEAAFALAGVYAALQREFPALADLTTAHVLDTCPYLGPLYPEQLANETDEHYYRKLGYDYSEGVVERQDKFLKRMSGVGRLYAALLISQPPQGTPPAAPGAAPLGLNHAWRWLSAVSNLEPRADITATLLYDMLEVAGSALAAAYGPQFFKLVRLLHTQYLPRLQQVTPEGCGGPVVRLEQRLQSIFSTGRVPPPTGQLKLYGW